MAKIRFTKHELKRQKDSLKRFNRYLPVLQLKKQQLQLEIVKISGRIDETDKKREQFTKAVFKWADVFAEDVRIEDLIKAAKLRIGAGNVAGIDIPILDGIDFQENSYSMIEFPLWADYAVSAVKEMITLNATYAVLQRQLEAVRQELRITTQRVNLFEKIKIPQARENIRRIRIALGELQAAGVITGKIAKSKILKKQEALV